MREASDKQKAFIATLVAERVYAPADTLDVSTLTTQSASEWITRLMAAPRKPKPTVAAGPDPLAAVEVSAYAIPTAGLQIPGMTFRGDLAFIEVREWRGKKYLNVLHGSVGDFNREKVWKSGPLAALAAVIAGRHVEYARAFGEHFTCCGRCKSPLTDQKSRELFLGPDCRKVWGL